MRTTAARSVDTQLLVDLLGSAKVDETVTFDQMSEALGRDVRNSARPLVQSARKILNEELGLHFESVRGVGYKRVDPNEVPSLLSNSMRKRVRRTANTAVRRSKNVLGKQNSVPASVQCQHNSVLATAGLIKEIVSAPMNKTIQAAVEEKNAPLSVADTTRKLADKLGIKV